MLKKIAILFLIFPLISTSQNEIGLSKQHHYIIKIGEYNTLSVVKNVTQRKKILNSTLPNIGIENIFYSSFSSIGNINAFTSFEDGSKTIKIKPTEILTESPLMSSVFYNDYKQKLISFKGLKKNSITNLAYTQTYSKPQLLTPFYFGDNIPLNNVEFKISFPKTVEIGFKIFKYNNEIISFNKTELNNIITYSWKMENVPPYFHEDNSPNRSYVLPHIIVFIKNIERNGEKQPFLESPADIYKWYTSITNNINNTNQDELKKLTLDLIKKDTTNIDRVKTIYSWVQKKINYIAFEDGMGGFVPRNASSVLNKKYGDCKDMANILNEMLHYANIEAYLTWIGTRNRPYSYEEIPTPITDNHMITTVVLDNKEYFLDPTVKYLSLKYPSPSIQGKQALIGKSKDKFNLKNVPIISEDQNIDKTIVNYSFSKDSIFGSVERKLSGYNKLNFLYFYDRNIDEDNSFWEKYLKSNSKVKLSGLSFKTNHFNDKNTSINYAFSTKESFLTLNNKIIIKHNFIDSFKLSKLKKDRKNPLEKDFKTSKIRIYNLTIPPHLTLNTLPNKVLINNSLLNFSIHYKITTTQILTIEIVYKRKFLYLNSVDFSLWNESASKINKALNQPLILIKS